MFPDRSQHFGVIASLFIELIKLYTHNIRDFILFGNQQHPNCKNGMFDSRNGMFKLDPIT